MADNSRTNPWRVLGAPLVQFLIYLGGATAVVLAIALVVVTQAAPMILPIAGFGVAVGACCHWLAGRLTGAWGRAASGARPTPLDIAEPYAQLHDTRGIVRLQREYGLQLAMAIGRERHPDARRERHAAFANSVIHLVTGNGRCYGGPTVREHTVARVFKERVDFDQAVELLGGADGLIFGPLRPEHREVWAELRHLCYDDDPADIEELERPDT